MKRIILLSLFIFSSNVFGQLYESIEKEAANVLLSIREKIIQKINKDE